jgi:hypothetical protein
MAYALIPKARIAGQSLSPLTYTYGGITYPYHILIIIEIKANETMDRFRLTEHKERNPSLQL